MMWLAGVMLGAIVIGLAAESVARVMVRRSPYCALPPSRIDRMFIDTEALPGLSQQALNQTNRHGERGDERPEGANVYRILVAGGSAAEWPVPAGRGGCLSVRRWRYRGAFANGNAAVPATAWVTNES